MIELMFLNVLMLIRQEHQKSALIATCKVREQDEMNCEANRDDKRLI